MRPIDDESSNNGEGNSTSDAHIKHQTFHVKRKIYSPAAAAEADDGTCTASLVADVRRLTEAITRARKRIATTSGRSDGAPGFGKCFTHPCRSCYWETNITLAATKGAAGVCVFSGQLTVKMALWNSARVEQARTITLYLHAQMKKATIN